MKYQKQTGLIWTAALLPLLITAALWARLPQQIPIRWGFDGTVDYGGKSMIWLFAATNPLSIGLMRLLPAIDPKKENYQKFEGSYTAFQLALALFLDALVAVTLIEALRPQTVNVGLLIYLLLAVLMTFLGNMMPKFRQTFFCGFKNAWTLSSERVWQKTHRLGGRMFFGLGLVLFFTAFLPGNIRFALLLAGTLIVSLTPTVMSYFWFRQERTN